MPRIHSNKKRLLGLLLLTTLAPTPATAIPISNDIDIAINHLLSVQQIQRPNTHDSWGLGFNSQFYQQVPSTLNNPYNVAAPQSNWANSHATTGGLDKTSNNLKQSKPATAALYATASALSASSKRCALYVRRALNKAGYTNFTPQPSAYMYESVMPNIGFSKIPTSNYTPMVGDVIVWRKKQGNPHGHIQIYNGEQWISDFKQPSMYIYGQNHNGYTIWRDLNHVNAIADDGVRLAMNN